MDKARNPAPIRALTRELIRTAPNALPASPFFAMGYPSTAVATVVASPGIPKRTEVMSLLVETTECIPRRKGKASWGVIRLWYFFKIDDYL
jgi:hypothetical protein